MIYKSRPILSIYIYFVTTSSSSSSPSSPSCLLQNHTFAFPPVSCTSCHLKDIQSKANIINLHRFHHHLLLLLLLLPPPPGTITITATSYHIVCFSKQVATTVHFHSKLFIPISGAEIEYFQRSWYLIVLIKNSKITRCYFSKLVIHPE